MFYATDTRTSTREYEFAVGMHLLLAKGSTGGSTEVQKHSSDSSPAKHAKPIIPLLILIDKTLQPTVPSQFEHAAVLGDSPVQLVTS
jgi:hypothetical protein